MVRRLGVIVIVLCMLFVFTLKANAQQAPSNTAPQGQGPAAQLRQEIQSLRQQAEQIHSQLQQLEAQAKPLRE